MIDNFKEIIKNASENDYSIVGFNVFGYEDAVSVVKAGEELNKPVLLMLNKMAIKYMPIERWSNWLLPLAKEASIPVGIHLDHCKNFSDAVTAIKFGFSSVLYDCSNLPLEENIKAMKEIVKIANVFDVAVEGEIGSVPYADLSNGVKDIHTSPEEARIFAKESGVDWVSVAVGQVHRLLSKESRIQFDRLEEIEKVVNKPLVIHGGSGIKSEDIIKMSKGKVGKINFGTALRVAFGETLKNKIKENPQEYDRMKMFQNSMEEVKKVSKNIISMVN